MWTLEINKILIPTDFSETANLALDHAVNLAKLLDSEIVLHHVISTFSFRVNLPEVTDAEEAHQHKLSGAVGAKLKQLADDIRQRAGIKVSTLISSGRIKDEVVRAAEQTDADLIVMGTHGVSGLREFFMGSNAFRVVSDAPCPVLTLRSTVKYLGFKNIIVPIDNSFHSREKLSISIRMARTYGATLHVCGLRSHDHNDEELNGRFRMKMKQVEDFILEKEVDHTITTLFCSNIAKTTMDYAKEKAGDLIIIVNEGEINDTGFFLGAYAQQIVNHSSIPVLSIRPTVGAIGNVVPY